MNAGKNKVYAVQPKQKEKALGKWWVRARGGQKLLSILGHGCKITVKDIRQREAAAWRSCSKLSKIWKSSLPRKFKLRLFSATVESVLLYGCEAWTTTHTPTHTPTHTKKNLDGGYKRMLRTVLNVSWKQHMTNKELYDNHPKISQRIRSKRTTFAGHFFRSAEPVSKMIL